MPEPVKNHDDGAEHMQQNMGAGPNEKGCLKKGKMGLDEPQIPRFLCEDQIR